MIVHGTTLDGLADDEIVVLARPLATTSSELERFAALLTDGERATAARYRFERDRQRSIVSRGQLRAILGEVVDGPIEIVEGAHGKPALVGGAVELNVSHADLHLYVAIARTRALGIDIEGGTRPIEVDELAPIVFTDVERDELARATDKKRAFLRGWSRKEAYLKARAVGLSLPLQDFSVTLGDDVTLTSEVDPVEASRFELVDLPAPDGYAAALAWEKGAPVARIRIIALEAR